MGARKKAKATLVGRGALVAAAVLCIVLGGCAGAGDWAGKDRGFVGPNGEGRVSAQDYDSEQEYRDAVSALNWEGQLPTETVTDDQGTFLKGALSIAFNGDCSEAHAHEIVASHGGTWIYDSYQESEGRPVVEATAVFPDAASREALDQLIQELQKHEEVHGAQLVEP